MHFYSGASIIFMKNLKRRQILSERFSFEAKFSKDHTSLLIFPVGGQIRETNFYSGASSIFTQNVERIKSLGKRILSVLKFSQHYESVFIFPVGGQKREKCIFIVAPPPFF